jgi:primosomal protein N'
MTHNYGNSDHCQHCGHEEGEPETGKECLGLEIRDIKTAKELLDLALQMLDEREYTDTRWKG